MPPGRQAIPMPWQNQPCHVELTLPPLGVIYLKPQTIKRRPLAGSGSLAKIPVGFRILSAGTSDASEWIRCFHMTLPKGRMSEITLSRIRLFLRLYFNIIFSKTELQDMLHE
jgi:hypothetical protein